MKEREAARRAQILEAVRQVVDEHGIDGVTMRRVANQASVSIGMVTYYYASKRELILDALTESNNLRHLQRRAIGGEGSNPRRMAAYFDVAFSEDPRLQDWAFTLLVWAQAIRDPELRKYHEDHFLEGRQSMAKHIRAGIEAGEVREDVDPDLISELFIAVRDGLGVQMALGADDVSPARARDLAEVFLNLLKPSSQDGCTSSES